MALPPTSDTIAAIASAPGMGAVGIVRLSGPASYAVGDAVFRGRRGQRPSAIPAGRVVYGRVFDADQVVDEALLLTFRGPASYTGQDVIELQTHGGPAVLRRVLELCVGAGARLAGPGEFTLRAYLSGRLDLAQAEGVLDLVNAATQSAMRNAASGLSGALSRRIDMVQTEITSAYAAVQAAFDYPDEGVPEAQLEAPLTRAVAQLEELLATADAGRLSRNGARLALIGRPNAGKSSLLNALLGYQRSLVSDLPGTTRDYLEAPLVIAGVPLTLIDTAGIRSTEDRLEASGVDLARQVSAAADLRVVLVDRSAPLSEVDEELLAGLVAAARSPATHDGAHDGAHDDAVGRTVVVASKVDLPAAWDAGALAAKLGDVPLVEVSAVTAEGLAILKEVLGHALLGDAADAELWVGNERHVRALEQAKEHVVAALDGSHDLAALELQDAITALAAITGRAGVADETLADIFARFCVGK
ncbi:MAG TPA: tRNA uridine-5-carboxymethylaminomethyl(34) synthesis GTPase MnmE [Trueperaceae bacterium]|nr:tRNA uridine-5-carboxymethylaminomethyl(34) synthesis GTPase MnmE [Trueperaceae bacterium]